MKRLTFVLFVICFFCQAPAQIKVEPELLFQNKNIDFGRVSNDTVLYAKFVMKNISKHNVVINYVNPDCSCTAFQVSKKDILPQDTASIVLTVDTRNKYGKEKLYTIVNYGKKEW